VIIEIRLYLWEKLISTSTITYRDLGRARTSSKFAELFKHHPVFPLLSHLSEITADNEQ